MDNDTWIEELQKNGKLRSEIVAWVKSYCWHKKRRYKDVWNTLYGLFERKTGERLPEKDRLDWLEINGLLGKLYEQTNCVR